MIAPAVPYECDSCPTTCTPAQVPGTPGTDGTNGTPGATGANAYTQVTTGFVMPAVGNTENVEVGDTAWMVPEQGGVGGQVVTVEFAGSLVVEAIIDGTNVTLRNDGYAENAAPGTAIPALAKVGVGGRPGDTGVAPGGALIASNNLSDVDSPATSLSNLGAGTAATLNLADVLQSANNLSDLANDPAARANLGVAIGADVQAFSAFLAGLVAAGPGVANRVPYLTAANVWALNSFTAFARTLVGAAEFRSAQVIMKIARTALCEVATIDLNVAGDVPLLVLNAPTAGLRYRVREIVIEGASVSLTTATAGLFSNPAGIGTIAADQSLAAATTADKFVDMVVSGIGTTDVLTGDNLYFRVGVPQGVPATARVWIFGDNYTV